MKIIIVSPFQNYSGGVESVNYVLSSILTELGYEIEFVTLSGYLPKKLVDFIGPFLLFFKVNRSKADVYISNGEYGISSLFKKNRITIHHGSYSGYYRNLKQFKSLLKRLKLVYKGRLQKIASFRSYNVCVSEYVKRFLSDDGVEVHEVIPNTIQLYRPAKISSDRNGKILFIGAYDYYGKGIDVLEKLASKFMIDAVTNGPIKGVTVLGQFSRDKLLELYSEYDLVILPSRFEGMSMTVIESLSRGTPVLISRVGDYERILNYCSDMVFDIDDSKDIENKINTIKSSLEYYINLSLKMYNDLYPYEGVKTKWEISLNGLLK